MQDFDFLRDHQSLCQVKYMLWTIIALIVLMFFIGLAAWFVFLWAAKTGQFDDVERPKHRMMDEDS